MKRQQDEKKNNQKSGRAARFQQQQDPGAEQPTPFAAQELPDEHIQPPRFDHYSNEKGKRAANASGQATRSSSGGNNSSNTSLDAKQLAHASSSSSLRNSTTTVPGAVSVPGTIANEESWTSDQNNSSSASLERKQLAHASFISSSHQMTTGAIPVSDTIVNEESWTSDQNNSSSASLERKQLAHASFISSSHQMTTGAIPVSDTIANEESRASLHDSSNTIYTSPGAVAISGINQVSSSANREIDDVSEDPPTGNTAGLAVALEVVDDDEESLDGGDVDEERLDPSLAMAQPVDVSKTGWLQKRRNRFLLLLGLILVVVAIVLAVIFGTRNTASGDDATPAPSSAPTSERFGRAFEIASSFTDEDALLDPLTPQYAALTWLVEEDEFELESAPKALQRYALATFFFATNGTTWNRTANFLSPQDECEWGSAEEGVLACNSQGMVTELRFEDANNLGGVIPSEVGSLAAMESITIRIGLFAGTLSHFLIPLKNLQLIWIQSSNLAGRIPEELGTLTKLTSITLSDNDLTGPIPPALGNLTSLLDLYLPFNHLTGTLPSELSSLPKMKVLNLQSNKLEGTIPSNVTALTSLAELRINGNSFVGSLEHVCTLGALRTFFADCYTNFIVEQSGEGAEISCPCCTQCCTDEAVLSANAGDCFRCASTESFCG